MRTINTVASFSYSYDGLFSVNGWAIRTEFQFKNLTGKDHLARLGLDGRMMFTWILMK